MLGICGVIHTPKIAGTPGSAFSSSHGTSSG